MKADIKRVILTDEALVCTPPKPKGLIQKIGKLLNWWTPPEIGETYEYTAYALGFRFEATAEELNLIHANGMLSQVALKLHDNFRPLTFSDLLGPEYVPEVNSQAELLRVEARVMEAAASWTHFFATMSGGA
jgi:hypothetical protein